MCRQSDGKVGWAGMRPECVSKGTAAQTAICPSVVGQLARARDWRGQGWSQDEAEPPRSPRAPPRRAVCFAVKSGLLASWPKERKDDIGLRGIEPHPEESLPGYTLDSALTLGVYSAV